jgi:hypothetical protein
MDYQNAQIAEIYDLVNSRSQDTDFWVAVRARFAAPWPSVVTG